MMRVGACLLAAACLAACAAIQPVPDAGVGLPSAAPRLVGADTPARREHSRILASYGGEYADPKLQKLLAGLAGKLAGTSERPDLTYRVTVLNSPSVNAFALPTGDLFITRGLVALANDTSELAAVLAHEIGHVSARHAFARADRERQAMLVSRVMTDVLNDPTAGALSLAKSKIALARFSREQELEADRIGVRTISRAGYDPYASSRFLASMGRNVALRNALRGQRGSRDPAEQMDFLSSHPATPERVSLAMQAAREIGAPGRGERQRDAFLDAVEGMVYGDDPSQGYARGNRFIHPVLGLYFEAPPGFSLENATDSIVGIAADGTALRLDTARPGPERPLSEHIREVVDGVTIGEIEEISVNGFPAVIGVARGGEWIFRVAVIRVGSDVYRLVFAVRSFTPEVDRRLRASIDSFRRLTTGEITAARPQRVAIARVRPGDTIETLAARMPAGDLQLERFMTLNGLASGATLSPGDRVKLIVE